MKASEWDVYDFSQARVKKLEEENEKLKREVELLRCRIEDYAMGQLDLQRQMREMKEACTFGYKLKVVWDWIKRKLNEMARRLQ